MNRLEELREQHRRGKDSLAAHQALINGLEYHLAEQDREIERLRNDVWRKGETVVSADSWKEQKDRAEKAEAGEAKAIKVLEVCEQIALDLNARVKELEKAAK